MLEISPDGIDGLHQIRSYTPGSLKVDGALYDHSLILSADTLQAWRPQQFESLMLEDLTPLMALNPTLVIVGTGAIAQALPSAWLVPFYRCSIGIEWMNSAAACRTYQLLRAEGRRVVAAILIR